MKRIFIYLLIAIIIIGIIGAIIYFLTRIQPENQTGQTGSLPSAALPVAALPSPGQNASGTLPTGSLNNGIPSARGVTTLNEPALDYFIDNQNNPTIIEPDGTIVGIANNNVDVLSSSQIQNIISTGFSYDGAKILISFGDANNPQTSVFDIKTKSWTPLPARMESPRWSPIDYRIAYLRGNTDGTATLETFDAAKTKNNITPIITFYIQDVALLWPTKNTIMFYDHPSIYTLGSVWSLDLQKKSFTPVIAEQQGLETAWSNTTTTRGIVFTGNASQYGGHLQLIDGSGGTLERLTFTTLPPKCLFNMFTPSGTASSTMQATTTQSPTSTPIAVIPSSYLALYCAVPRDQSSFSSSRLPDDYEDGALFTSDNIYRINTTNGNIDTLFSDQSQNVDVSNMKIFNGSLFFINRYNQRIYSLEL